MSGTTVSVDHDIHDNELHDNDLHDDHLQLRARQCRAIAATSRDADQRAHMLELARDYDRLAERLTAMNSIVD
jgi:hypothetical protein